MIDPKVEKAHIRPGRMAAIRLLLRTGSRHPYTRRDVIALLDEVDRLRVKVEQVAATDPKAEKAQHTRGDAVLVMTYVEGWLDNDFPEASRYLREHMEEIADQMVEDHCAAPDVVVPPATTTERGE